MKKLELNKGRGSKFGQMFALVDDDMYKYLNQWNWHTVKPYKTFYACRAQYNGYENGKRKNNIHFKLHRVILGVTDPNIGIDHIDGNGLNCQKSNLRIATRSQNAANSRKPDNCSSKYKGVSWNGPNRKWQVTMRKDNEFVRGGNFRHEDDAARAYNELAKKLHGEFAKLNIIPSSK